jgi:ElaB/YqjD/DUF883 family membrane-anchored ribosome-binding protein
MRLPALRPCFSVSLFSLALLLAGCNDDNNNGTDAIGSTTKRANKDIAQTTKSMDQRVADELSPLAEGLEDFGNSLQKHSEDATYDVRKSIEAKLPDVQKLADTVKARLNAGNDDARQAAKSIDEKLADLKAKLTALGTDATVATKDAKEDAADAFKSLIDNIQNGLKKIG